MNHNIFKVDNINPGADEVVTIYVLLDAWGKSSADVEHCNLVRDAALEVMHSLKDAKSGGGYFLDCAHAQGNVALFSFRAKQGWGPDDYHRAVTLVADAFASVYEDKASALNGSTRISPPPYPSVGAYVMSKESAARAFKRYRDYAYRDAVKAHARLLWDERTVRHSSVNALLGNLHNAGEDIAPELLYGTTIQGSTQALFVGKLSVLDIMHMMSDPTNT